MGQRLLSAVACVLFACSPKKASRAEPVVDHEISPALEAEDEPPPDLKVDLSIPTTRTTIRAGEPREPAGDPAFELLWVDGASGCVKVTWGGFACWDAVRGTAATRFPESALSKARCGPLCAYPIEDSDRRLSHRPFQVFPPRCTVEQKRIVSCDEGLPIPALDPVIYVRTTVAQDMACAFRGRSVWCWGKPQSVYGRLATQQGRAGGALQVHLAMRSNPDAAVVDIPDRLFMGESCVEALKAPKADSPATEICLVRRSCERETKALPPCTSSLEATAWERISKEPQAFLGQKLVVEGALRVLPRGCTAAGCYKHCCCNECEGQYVLGHESSPAFPYAVLEGVDMCRGDESRLCCPFRAQGQRVVATGVFSRWPWHPLMYAIAVSSLCAR